MSRQISRADTALHRNVHDARHPLARGARLARHLAIAAFRPTRSLQELISEIDRRRLEVDRVVLLRARMALDAAAPYLHDETGEVWR